MNVHTPTHRRTIGHSLLIAVAVAATLVLLWPPVVTDLAPGAVAGGLLAASPSWPTAVAVGFAVGGLHALVTRTGRRRRRGDGRFDV